MSIANAWSLLYKQVNEQDRETQRGYLKIISEKVRNMATNPPAVNDALPL